MTAGAGEVEVRWLPGLGSAPGAVDVTMIGPLGPIERAVTLSEALATSAVIDLWCPPSNLHHRIRALVERSTSRQAKR